MPKKFSKEFIVKFQRPLYSTASYDLVLLYNEDRSFEQQMEVDDDKIESLFPNKEYKVYWKCRINKKTKMLETIEIVEDQEW